VPAGCQQLGLARHHPDQVYVLAGAQQGVQLHQALGDGVHLARSGWGLIGRGLLGGCKRAARVRRAQACTAGEHERAMQLQSVVSHLRHRLVEGPCGGDARQRGPLLQHRRLLLPRRTAAALVILKAAQRCVAASTQGNGGMCVCVCV
jgi:hypothetical protein